MKTESLKQRVAQYMGDAEMTSPMIAELVGCDKDVARSTLAALRREHGVEAVPRRKAGARGYGLAAFIREHVDSTLSNRELAAKATKELGHEVSPERVAQYKPRKPRTRKPAARTNVNAELDALFG